MSDDRDELQRLLDAFLARWNADDTAGMAACWRDTGDVVSTEGLLVRGREAIAALLAEQWAGPLGGTRAVMEVQAIRPLGPGLALVDADMHITPERRPATAPGLHMHVVFLASLHDGAWWFEAVRPYVLYSKATRSFDTSSS